MKRRRYHLTSPISVYGVETFLQIDIDRGADAVRCVRVRMRVRARMCAWSSTCAWSCDCGGLCRAPIVDHARSMRSHAEPCDHLIIPMSHIFWEICVLMGVRAHSAAAAAMCACEYEVER